MARLNPRPASSDTESERARSSPSRHTTETPPSHPPSDAESEQRSRVSKGKRKSSAAHVPERVSQSQKRRRTGGDASQTPSSLKFYDPEQAPEERRQVRKGFRSLIAELHDSRAEFLQPNSRGLEQTLKRSDELFKNVKQTSEATIDSRLLVETADLSYKKISNLTLGDGTTGIDVDDFITKCIIFMKQGDEPGRGRNAPPSTQTQSRRRNRDEEDDDAGDTMNWDYLGRNACFLYNSRPCLTGFLLGPLSTQKKVRKQTQRKAREAQTQPGESIRPIQLGQEDLERQESANLTEICTEIARVLQKAARKNLDAAKEELNELEEEGEVSDDQAWKILRRHHIADNECIPLFDFCINPKSFGQSVENIFYVSFLIKEGRVGLGLDGQGLPTLGMAESRSMKERQETQRNQVILALSMESWEDIIKAFGITESIIPHRHEKSYDDGTLGYGKGEADGERREEEGEDSDAYS